MSRSARVTACALLIVSTFLLLVPAMASAQAAGWFAPEWSNRRVVTIGNTTGQVLNNHQVLVTLTAPSFNFSKALSNGSDLRVTDGNGTTLIPFWIESWSATAGARVWVRLPTLPLLGATIYFYYGNPAPPAPVTGPQPPIGPLAKHPANPMDVANAPYGVDNLLPENIVFTGGKYYIVLRDSGANPYVISMISSTNLVDWVYEGVMITSAAGEYPDSPYVVQDGSNWYIFYNRWFLAESAPGTIAVARSTSGILGPYQVINTSVLAPGPLGGWEDVRVAEPFVFKRADGVWVMVYMGDAGLFTEQIGYATSSTGILGPYVKYPDNPILAFGEPGSLDAGTIADPWVHKFGSTYYIGYAASPTKESWNTTYATTQDWITFTKSNQVILDQGPRGAWDDESAFRGGVSEIGGMYIMPYAGARLNPFTQRFGIAYQNVVGPAPTVVNNPDAVFSFYDGFGGTSLDTAKWTYFRDFNEQGAATVSGGLLSLTAPGGTDVIVLVGPELFQAGMLLEARARHVNADGSGNMATEVGFGDGRFMNALRILSYDSPQFLKNVTIETVGGLDFIPMGRDLDNNFLLHRIYWNTLDVRFALDDDLPEITTSNLPTFPLSPWLMALSAPTPTTLEVDWIRVRRWAGVDPIAIVGAEEVRVGPPAAPSSLLATAASSSQINLAWTDNASNETGFKIERAPATGSFVQIATVGANVTTYPDTGRSPSTVYRYRVRANNTNGDSAYSNTATATTPAAPATSPAAPSSLIATAVSSSQVTVTWTDNASNETEFRIERALGTTGSFSQIATTAANVTTYSDTGRSASTIYRYRVRAANGAGTSAYSNTASVTTPASLPAAPTSLSATVFSLTQVNLSWTDMASNESSFRIERATGTGSFSEIATTSANVTSYSDTGRTPNTTYQYRVRASNGAGNSGYSNTASATTTLTAPAAPSSLTTTAISSSQVDLAWTDNASNETGFRIERAAGGGTFGEIATVGANIRNYSDNGRTGATLYQYRVRATNSGGNSSYSNTSSVTTPCPTGQYLAQYYGNTTLSGTPAFVRCEHAIMEDYGTSGPGGGLASDNFSVRWTGRFNFAAGTYTFVARTDDGVRVFVDGTQIINAWVDQSATTNTVSRSISAGVHEVKVEYYERAGSAMAKVNWYAPTSSGSCASGQFLGEYFNNVSLSGSPAFRRCESSIRYDWGTSSPGSGLGSDNFSVRWTGRFDFAAGTYTFVGRSDDGIRLWVDGTQIINAWVDRSATTNTASRTLSAGGHDIRVDYYERAGNAMIEVSW